MSKDTVPAPESPVTVGSNAGTKPKLRVVRSQKEIHDAEQAQLAALESICMETLTDYRRSLLAVKIAKLKSKVTLYIVKRSAQTDVVQTKKVRMNFESEDVIRLLDARRLHDHQFTDKAVNSAVTKHSMIAESYNKGFVALPKGGYGVALQENEITVVYGALPEDRRRRTGGLFCAASRSSRRCYSRKYAPCLVFVYL